MSKVKDPICGMTIDAEKAAGTSEFDGKTFYFCSPSCQEKFEANPKQFISAQNEKIDLPVNNEDVLISKRNDYSTANGAGERVDLPITGMTCAACANRIEKKLNKQAGVSKASVNFATGRASVDY
ncbi:MAG TPA: YHS domain-containing protein, partial [Pyrinomonadaceae bacterium]|nr:YHS domain-containing protein [Pyrinomonadaceae bacterium]